MAEREVHDEKLANGLRLLLLPSRLSPVASVQVWARVGSADERPGEAGLAHFHEHMLFKGTERRGVGEIAGEVEGAGGRINAYTTFDVTVYHATLPADAVATGVDVLVDAVRHSRFDALELRREQEVVIEEIRRSADSPGHVLGDLMFREAYRAHPYRAPILGTAESVAALDRERCLAFFRRWYAADNLTFVAVGDFDAPALRERVAALFADARPGGARRERPDEPRHEAIRAAVLRRSFEGHRIELAWPSASFRDEDAPYLDLLSFLLGECESSRLVRHVREDEGLVDKIDSSSYTPFDRGLFSVSFETDEERARPALAAIAAEIERLRREPVSEAELERARANFLASEHFERESVSGQANKIGSFELLGAGWATEAGYVERVRGATAADLRRVARAHLDPVQLTAVALIPDEPDARLREQDLAAPFAASAARTARAASVIGANGAAAPASRPRPAAGRAPLPAAAPAPRDGAITTHALPGGGRLHVAPRGHVPVVAGRAAFVGGLLAEDAGRAGLSSFLSAMWTRGTAGRSAAEFANAVEDLAADVSGFSGRSSLGVTFECTSDKLEPTLDLLAEVLLEPRFEEDELESERRETLAAIDRREDQLAQRVFQLFGETEFAAHPYRLPMLGYRESVEGFTGETVRAHHARLLRAPNLVVAVAGDADPDALARMLGERLAGLPGAPFLRPLPPPEPRAGGIREAVVRKEREQAHLVLGFRGTDVADPDRFGLEVLAQVLGGQGGRLFLDLRDRRSLAYSVSAMNVEGLAPGFFAVYIGTAPEKLDVARAGILEHLTRLVDAAPDEAELERARRHLVGNFVIDQQRSSVRATHVALDSLYGLGPNAHAEYAARIAAITRDDVLRIARRFFRLDAYTVALVRP